MPKLPRLYLTNTNKYNLTLRDGAVVKNAIWNESGLYWHRDIHLQRVRFTVDDVKSVQELPNHAGRRHGGNEWFPTIRCFLDKHAKKSGVWIHPYKQHPGVLRVPQPTMADHD